MGKIEISSADKIKFYFRSPNKRKALVNIIWLFLDRFLRLGAGLFVNVWVARYLGPEQFGTLSYALALVALFGAIASLGLDGIVVRDIVRDKNWEREILGSAFFLKLIGGILATGFAVGGTLAIRPGEGYLLTLVGIIAAGMVVQAFDSIDFFFQARVQSRYTVIAKNTAFTIIAFTKVWLICVKAPLVAFAWAGLAELALGAVGLIVAYRLAGHSLGEWRVSLKRCRQLIGCSWPLVFSGLVIAIYMRIDQIMLGELLGDGAVGIYSAATRISEVWYFVPTAIVSTAAPFITAAKAAGEELYYRRVRLLLALMVVMALAIAVPMTYLSKGLVVLLFGLNYAAAGAVLAIHIWAAVFVFLGVASNLWIINEGVTRFAFFATSLGAITNITLNLLLIPTYGAVGAAIATVISQAVASYFAFGLTDKTKIIFLFQTRALLLEPVIRALAGVFTRNRPI